MLSDSSKTKVNNLESSVVVQELDGWMDGCFVYRRSTLKGHIASNNLYII